MVVRVVVVWAGSVLRAFVVFVDGWIGSFVAYWWRWFEGIVPSMIVLIPRH